MPGSRQVRLGLSAMMVPRPTRMASERARKRWAWARANSPVTQVGAPCSPLGTRPSLPTASFKVTAGRPCVTRSTWPSVTAKRLLPGARLPSPRCRPRSSAEAHGPPCVDPDRPWRLRRVPDGRRRSHRRKRPPAPHGRKARASCKASRRPQRSPARSSATASAWGRPPGAVSPRPTISPDGATTTQPTEGLGQVVPSPRLASASACAMWSSSLALMCQLGFGR